MHENSYTAAPIPNFQPAMQEEEYSIDIENSDLIYVAEGNANIVLKLPQHKQVLRLPKTEKEGNERHDSKVLSYLIKCCRYTKALENILGKKHVYLSRIVPINSNQLERLNEVMHECRPKNRIGKVFNGQFALLMQDATLGFKNDEDHPTFSVEIKPKQGWMFDNTVNHLFSLQGQHLCRYCSMQYLKLKNGKIHSRSKYCPMDLFSGCVARMRKSIGALLEQPQNNLRIFMNGELIYGENKHTKDDLNIVFDLLGEEEFYSLLLGCLLSSEISNSHADTSINGVDDSRTCLNRSNLSAESILRKVLDLQLLAKKNMPGIAKLKLDDTKSYKALNSLVLKHELMRLEDMTPEEQYMIGATLMDASLMITFHRCDNPITSNWEEMLVVNGRRYFTKVTLLDLDPKPDNHFKKYLKQTNEAYDVAMKSMSVDE